VGGCALVWFAAVVGLFVTSYAGLGGLGTAR
jgi:hypothetical protein